MLKSRFAYGASAAVIALAASTAVFAQETTGGIRGQIVDASGVPQAGATVTVVHQPSGTSTTVMTNESGVYDARSLRVGGPYLVTVAAPGFPSQSAQVANIGIGTPANLDILVTGGDESSDVTELGEIVVTGIAGGGRLTTSPRTNIDQASIEVLPSISRDIKDFVRTSPFATTDPTNNDALSIGGQNTRFNAFLIDGIRQGDDFGLNGNGYPTQRSPISISTLEAVSVDVAPYDVQYGTFTGGVINSVTKSGGNNFEGEAFYETTNDGLQGNSFTYTDFRTGSEQEREVSGTFEETTYGATLSGPILRDRLFFLLNYEMYESTQPVLTGVEGSGATNEVPGITQADVDLVRQITQDVYGYDPLDWSADELLIEDEKWFGKLDWNINDRHRAVLSYQQTEGGDLRLAGSSTSSTFPSIGLLSQAYVLESNLKTYKGQIFSDWTDRFSTELSASIKEVENISSPLAGTDFASFQVYLDDPRDSSQPRRSVRLGPDRSRHANALTVDTTQFRLIGNYAADGGHRFTGGFEREDFDVFNLFVQFANGEYEFASIEDYRNQQASYIGLQNTVTGNKNDGAASFSYAVNSLFLQDEWDITDTLTLNFGVRYDWYTTDDSPQANPLFEDTYGFASNSNIDGISVVQPRFGFNWQPTDSLTVYGGIGRFQGGSPNVWVSNNFTNTGNLIGFFDCRIDSTYTSNFTNNGDQVCPAGLLSGIDGFNPPQEAFDRVADSANLGTGTINIIDPSFDAPSIWKTSIGALKTFDLTRWGLGEGWNLRAEYVHSELENAVGWEDLNANLQQDGVAPDGRPTFFGTDVRNQTVLMLTNFQGGETDQVAVALSKDWYDGWLNGAGFDFSYTYLDTTDQHAGTSSVALSNYQNLGVINPNDPEVATSNYEIEEAFKLNLRYQRAFFGDYLTRIGLFAQRRSGLPFSYVFDQSASNLVGENLSARRHLLYVPNVDGSGMVTAGSDPIARFGAGFDFAGFNDFLQRTGLIEYAGQIAPRNAFKSPDVNIVDIHLEQELPAFFPGGARLSLYADIENFGNLLNDEWGVIQQTGFPYLADNVAARNCQAVAQAASRQTCSTGTGNWYQYDGFGQDSASAFSTNSVWQAKIGIRYKF